MVRNQPPRRTKESAVSKMINRPLVNRADASIQLGTGHLMRCLAQAQAWRDAGDRVAVCGYHGWQDWYIGSTSCNNGVPLEVRALTHHFMYNDLESLEKLFKEFPDQIAAVIMEPINTVEPKEGFLELVRNMSRRHGALLIFDEIITGFRYAKGGAQEYFGVTPDLATFGKGLADEIDGASVLFFHLRWRNSITCCCPCHAYEITEGTCN